MTFDLKTTDYVKQHFEEVLKLLPVVLENQEENTIHQFRIKIKKLHALVKLLEKTEPESDIKEKFRPVRKLFKKVGVIREIQLDLKKLIELNKSDISDASEWPKKLGKKNAKLSKDRGKWNKNIHDTFKIFIQYDYKLNYTLLEDYFRKLIIKANNFMLQGDFHEARKNIKSALYLKDLLSESDQKSIGIDFTFLNELQEKIGNWNDLFSSSLRNEEKEKKQLLEPVLKQLTEELKKDAQAFLLSVYTKDKS